MQRSLSAGAIRLLLRKAWSVRGSSISGTIPPQIALMPKLEQLNVHDNTRISGTLPTQLGSLEKLSEVYAYQSSVSGTIPSELGTAATASARQMNLLVHRTAFSGTLPSQLATLTAFRYLHAYEASFSGTLPSEVPSALGRTDQFRARRPRTRARRLN